MPAPSPPAFLPAAALAPGSKVHVVAPSGPFDAETFHGGLARLRARYEVVHAIDLFAREGYLAGDDARRIRELREAFADPSARAIVAARGGYGLTRILDALPLELLRESQKLVIGFSDLTALHARVQRAGLRSIHGPMVCFLAKADEPSFARWCALAEGAIPEAITGLEVVAEGKAEGPLLGGNLAVLAALAGTPDAPRLEGAILLLEDIGERPYRIDRMLTQLRQGGALAKLAGVVVGAFTDSTPGKDGVTAEAVLAERLGDLGVPVLSGLRAGHIDDNLPLPLGARVALDSGARTLRFLEPAAT